MVNNIEEGITSFVATPEKRQIAPLEELNTTNIYTKGAAPNRKVGLSLNSLILALRKQPPLAASIIFAVCNSSPFTLIKNIDGKLRQDSLFVSIANLD